jgi:proline dehydrogenase
MLRNALLYLSRQRALRNWVETSPTAWRLSSRFVAGHTLDEALAVCKKISAQGMTATLDYLGESVKSLDEATRSRDMYVAVLNAMRDSGIEPNVSLKLTQFGLDFSAEACEENVDLVVKTAAEVGGFVRVDMESSEYTERTLDLVLRLHQRHATCGAVIQAYLHRSANDIDRLNAARIRIRLCKGAYLEPPALAFETKAEVDRNYMELARKLLTTGVYPAIATHDERMIERVERFAANNGIPRDGYEFQMLFGIRRDLQKRLLEEGYRVRLYVPFGEAWYPYFMRRLAERPANLLFLARNLLRH